MKLKVCGLNNPENIKEIINLNPDFIGFIFYSGSKRFVLNQLNDELLAQIPRSVKKVGVFVNEEVEKLLSVYKLYKLDYVQLHGNEDPDYCKKLDAHGIPLIKAFMIDEHFDFQLLKYYAPYCEYFLFDTKGALKGGNGIKFNWNLIKNYKLDVPFFLSGGIGFDDIDDIQKLKFDMLYAIDVNSKFETEPGIKDVNEVHKFCKKIKPINQLVI